MLLIAVAGVAHAQERIPPARHTAAAVLVDADTGDVLFARNADKRIAPASLTKIMTLLLALDAVAAGETSMDDVVRVDGSVNGVYGAKLGLKPGDTLTVDEAVRGVAVASANDAAVALAVHIAGSEQAFVARMNAKVVELGLADTHYANPNGLPAAGQRTTALDTARLSRFYIRRHPEALAIHSMRSYAFRGVTHTNHNTLLRSYPGIDGLKTGYIKASGYCLVATAMRNGVRLISVALGAPSPAARDAASRELLDYGFSQKQ